MRLQPWMLSTLLCLPAAAQQQSLIGSEFSREGQDFAKDCTSFKSIFGCGQLLVTGSPLHLTAGSIAPGNGVGFGPAFVFNPDLHAWRVNINLDAVVSTNQSWRGGAYIKLSKTPTAPNIVVVTQRPTHPLKPSPPPPAPEINLYVQGTSLNKLEYYGEGNATSRSSLALFGMTESIAGANAILPLFGNSGVSLLGEANGRFVDIRGRNNDSAPSIETLYTEATAPGMLRRPAFLQTGEGVRFARDFAARFDVDYSVQFQQFTAPSYSTYSFRRLNLDFSHQFALYRRTTSAAASAFGPDGDKETLGQHSYVRNREGSIELGVFLSESFLPSDHVVPFYFQPTLGGSDINGDRGLPSYPDMRFRAPNQLLFHGTIEHSIWGPIGAELTADFGKVALTRSDIGFDQIRHSLGVGLTVRAGGFPALSLLFSWGGTEGRHTSAVIAPGLLGATGRPSLF